MDNFDKKAKELLKQGFKLIDDPDGVWHDDFLLARFKNDWQEVIVLQDLDGDKIKVYNLVEG